MLRLTLYLSKPPLLRRVLMLFLLVGFCLPGWSQTYSDSWDGTKSGDHHVTNNGSDYTVTLTWSNILSPTDGSWATPCDCNDVGLQQVQYGTAENSQRSPYSNPVLSFGGNGGGTLTSSTANVGPSFNQTLHLWIRIDGQDDAFLDPCGSECENYGWSVNTALFTIRTAKIKNPINLDASDNESEGSLLNRIVLTWEKGTDIPAANVGYKIYRGSTLIHTTAIGDESYTYTDSLTTPGGLPAAGSSYTYKVQTYTNDWGGDTSTGATNIGSTLSLSLDASNGTFPTKVKLSWNSVSTSADNIRIERSIPLAQRPSSITSRTDTVEELNILNKHAKAYTDTDVIPGYLYNYYITALNEDGNDIVTSTDKGWMKPNGTIKGQVSSRGGAGVQNVLITVAYDGALDANKAPANSGYNGPFTALTDVDGYYEIRNIYYYDSARFSITPSYLSHGFTPPNSFRILDLNGRTQTGVNFTDTTAITVSGYAKFQAPSLFGGASGAGFGVEKATIAINGVDYGIRTDEDGFWSYALSDSGNYGFKIYYLHHQFLADSLNFDIGNDKNDIDFLNMQVDSIEVRVQDGCQNPLKTISTQAGGTVEPQIKVVHTRGTAFFDGNFSVNATGNATIVLPAGSFRLSVDNPAGTSVPHRIFDGAQRAQLDTIDFDFDLSLRDSMVVVLSDTIWTIIPPDTLSTTDSLGNPIILPGSSSYVVNEDTVTQSLDWQADFVYFGPFEVIAFWEDAGAEIFKDCNAGGTSLSDSIILLESNVSYPLTLWITDAASGCAVDTGSIKIWDFVSDKESSPATLPIQNGYAYYLVEAGIPNVSSGGSNPHQKYFYTKTSAGARADVPNDWWVMVTGAQSLSPTFTSRSPQLPDIVIHDPPGDNSYSWIEKGSNYRYFSNTSYEISGSGGFYLDLLFGTSIKTPISGTNLGVRWQLDFQAGRENFTNNVYENNITFTETFSTSADPLFTGNDGDVYVGKATNQQFAIAKVLTYNDSSNCIARVDDKPALYPLGIATTFIYSEKHIKNVVIPQIVYLDSALRRQARKTAPGTERSDLVAEADSFGMDASNWRSILGVVDAARGVNAIPYETGNKNISFSSGASYENVVQQDTTSGGSYLYTAFVDIETALGARFQQEGGAWLESQLGIAAKFRHSFTKDEGNDTTNTLTIGYHLEDDDIGDYFSVDILKDTVFGVPAFKLFAGTSSCPHEDGTQPRDSAEFNIFPPDGVHNIPIGGAGNMTAYLTNVSASQEAREYHVRVIPNTNPQGAVIKIGGRIINNTTASFFLDPFQTTEVALTVEQGPTAANYDSIGIMMYPPCEYELWENNGNLTSGDTTWLFASFQSECTQISLNEPVQGWLVNANSNNQLLFDFAGYDLNNPYFNSITIEYKPNGQGWLVGPSIPRDSIVDVIHTYLLDVSGYPDGAYTLRARANCSSGKGTTYSTAVSGRIDRNSIGPFGIPTPSDGFLRLGQEISITFDKDIDCGFNDPAPTYATTISLMRTDDSTFIPLTVQCSENQDRIILVPGIDLFNMPELEGVLLIASVQGIQDDQGNSQDYPITWAFLVNASPVNWDPDTLDVALSAGFSHTISSTLKNTSVLSKAFTIEKYPVWLTPTTLAGSVLSNGEYEINFLVDPTLPVGIYSDTVTAMINGWPEYLIINYEALAVPPNWKVNPEDYTYSMSVVAVFSLDQTDTNLSRNDRDLVAAIFNGEVRGIAQLEYVERFDKYMAFITVYSDIIANEEINFSLWRASNGVEYRAAETLFFADNAIYGRIGAPEIFHTDGVYQVIPLKQGWNWVSLNVDNSDMTIHNLLNSLGSPQVGNDITVKRKDGSTAQYTQIATPIIFANQWTGTLAQLDNKQAYQIHLSDVPDTLRIPGTPITHFSNIDVLSGWNWIGFQPQSAQPVGQALSSLNLRNQDLLKSQESFSEYHKGWDVWYGPLRFMEPGKGYKLKLKSGVNYNDLIYSRLGTEDFQVDHTRFESSMTIVAKIGFENELLVDHKQLNEERLLIGAFMGDSCRGYGQLEWVEFMGEYQAVFSVHGNQADLGREMEFRVYDTFSGHEFACPKKPEKYISDYFLGHVRDPYVLFERLALPEAGYFLEQNYPNPYDSKTSIRFILPQAEHVRLTVFDQFGKKIQLLLDEEMSAGEHTAIFEAAKLPSGIYHYSIEAGEFRASRKMVKF